jgi:hypothetical protein
MQIAELLNSGAARGQGEYFHTFSHCYYDYSGL